jgi:hypothetical protein
LGRHGKKGYHRQNTVINILAEMTNHKATRLFGLGYLFIFLLAFIPRVIQPTTRFALWYSRSQNFWEGLRIGELTETYQQYHPGVTTMWISGLGSEIYRLFSNLEENRIPIFTDPRNPTAQAGLIAMGVVIAGSIVFVVFLVSRVTSQLVAFTAGFFLALDPFYITHSQMIHVDAFLATFMLVSSVSWIAFLKHKKGVYLLLSGLFGGLAFLTKSPSYYLIPFVGLVALMQEATDERWITAGSRTIRSLWPRLRHLIITLAAWVGLATATVFILWPAMWVKPLRMVGRIFDGVFFHAEQAHVNNQFFAGDIITDDPGFMFYLASLAWQTTATTLIGTILVIYFIIRRRDSGGDNRIWLYLLLYAGGFVLMMTLGATKWGRYLLPAIVAFDVLAAWGIVKAAELFAHKIHWPVVRRRVTLFVVLVLLVQAILVIRYMPNFGTHFNQLLGGSRVAQNILPVGIQGEGMDLAADFLNSLPGADRLRVATQPGPWLMYQTRFDGFQVGLEDNPHFVLFHINYIQRAKLDGRLREIWETCMQEGPYWSASFDSVTYVWLCSAFPRNPDDVTVTQERDIKLGDQINLIGFDLSGETISAGETLTVTLFWQSDGQVRADNHVFVHLTDEVGNIIAQHDGVPVLGQRPTWNWLADEIIVDEYDLLIPDSADEGLYSLSAGMYDFGTLVRLPAIDANGVRYLDDRFALQSIEIIPQQAIPDQ